MRVDYMEIISLCWPSCKIMIDPLSFGLKKPITVPAYKNNSKTLCKSQRLGNFSYAILLSRIRNQKYFVYIEFDQAHEEKSTLTEYELSMLYTQKVACNKCFSC